MAVINVVKYDGAPDVFAWKHPHQELGTWTQKENASSESSVSISNYSKYSLTSNDQYYVVSRIGNTFLYVVTDSENKDTVNSALTALGY